MFIELDNENKFVQYHENRDTVAPEHKKSVVEITDELYKLLLNKKPWKLSILENKVYDIQDIKSFIEIEIKNIPNLEERIKALELTLLEVL